MSRTTTRIVTGFVTSAFVGFGAALGAPAASADTETEGGLTTLDTLDVNEFSYYCETTDGVDSDDEATGTFAFEAPGSAETGQSIDVIGDGGSTVFYFPGEEVAAGDATLTVEFALSGDAAPQETVSFSATNTSAFTPTSASDIADEAAWSEIEPETLDLTQPGTIEYVPGTVTYDLSQESGPSVTVCEPQEDLAAIASTDVTGDPIEDDEDDGNEDDGDDQNGGGDDEDENDGEGDGENDEGDDQNGGGDDEGGDEGDGDGDQADEGGLPVTGAALTGLVAAAVAAVGGGSAAMYFSRRRGSKAEGEGQEA